MGLSFNNCLKYRLCNSMSSNLTAKTESSHNFGTKIKRQNLNNCGTEVVIFTVIAFQLCTLIVLCAIEACFLYPPTRVAHHMQKFKRYKRLIFVSANCDLCQALKFTLSNLDFCDFN